MTVRLEINIPGTDLPSDIFRAGLPCRARPGVPRGGDVAGESARSDGPANR